MRDGYYLKKMLKRRNVEASLILFQQDGYHGVTVDRIVEYIGASKGGVIIISNQKMNCYMKSMMCLSRMLLKSHNKHTTNTRHLLRDYVQWFEHLQKCLMCIRRI